MENPNSQAEHFRTFVKEIKPIEASDPIPIHPQPPLKEKKGNVFFYQFLGESIDLFDFRLVNLLVRNGFLPFISLDGYCRFQRD